MCECMCESCMKKNNIICYLHDDKIHWLNESTSFNKKSKCQLNRRMQELWCGKNKTYYHKSGINY